ncbi:MAG TPA: DUF6175 family protein [Spirochaetales bacterium]|nr:DUF6175 family protein [Spirochaetales bacterium]HRY54289.1 DUF6175 family protein [Spirochaetia bacterium]
MSKSTSAALALAALAFLASCASSPAPAPTAAPAQSAPAAAPKDNAAKSRAMALVQGGADAGQAVAPPAAAPASPAAPAAPASVDQPAPVATAPLTPEEQAYLENYLARLNYMVYYNADAKIDAKLAKMAVTQANRYLIEKLGRSVVDFDQIEKNKADQRSAYESETGGSISLIQYIAQKQNADVYVELDFTVASETRDGKYYASAMGSMKLFDTSTASLLGSVALISQPAFSPSSLEAAVNNAVLGSVWVAMPKMAEQSKELLKGSLGRGVRYEIILQKTPDSRQVSQLRRALAKKMREVEQASYSPDETRLYVYTFQKGDKVEDAMYDAASSAGLNDLNLVYSRGKSYTFNSGL